MGLKSVLVFHSRPGRDVPESIRAIVAERALRVESMPASSEVLAAVNRSYPAAVIIELGDDRAPLELCRTLKSDPFTAIVPVVLLLSGGDEDLRVEAFEAGADEVLTESLPPREVHLRLRHAIERANRDVGVHPTTRLPGTVQIERDIAERLASGQVFACCYADLDHFKEFNDRYGYYRGDRVIRLLSRILRDVVRWYAPSGFIGHIGGDDFIFNVPMESMSVACQEIVDTFDELIPYQYTEQDRRAGYFLGKDRRGNLHRVPLMTLSIGVVTNQHRHFSHTGRVSELATEMKAYAKTLPGSLYAVDRRRDPVGGASSPGVAENERSLSQL